MNVINLRAYTNATRIPTLVLLDLQEEYLATSRLMALAEAPRALKQCELALSYARRLGLPVAYGRWIGRTGYFNPATHLSGWIRGFEPTASDIVFERTKPSCYSSETFCEVMTASGGDFVLAGFAGETTCLATVLDAFHRDHSVTFLVDASASHSLQDSSSVEVHQMIGKLASVFGTVRSTRDWINETEGSLTTRPLERIS